MRLRSACAKIDGLQPLEMRGLVVQVNGGKDRQLGHRVQPQRSLDCDAMHIDRVDADAKHAADLLLTEALADQLQDFALARRERLQAQRNGLRRDDHGAHRAARWFKRDTLADERSQGVHGDMELLRRSVAQTLHEALACSFSIALDGPVPNRGAKQFIPRDARIAAADPSGAASAIKDGHERSDAAHASYIGANAQELAARWRT